MANRIGIIVAAHGSLADAMVATAEFILGRETDLRAFNFPEGEAARISAKRLRELIKKTNRGGGVIILSDLFGGTPGSLALSMVEDEAVEVISGVNLPMVLSAAGLDPALDLPAATQALLRSGRESIRGAVQTLKGEHGASGA